MSVRDRCETCHQSVKRSHRIHCDNCGAHISIYGRICKCGYDTKAKRMKVSETAQTNAMLGITKVESGVKETPSLIQQKLNEQKEKAVATKLKYDITVPKDLTCPECKYVASDIKGYKAHARKHMPPVECRYCHEMIPNLGVGNHEKWCDENPNKAVAAPRTSKKKSAVRMSDPIAAAELTAKRLEEAVEQGRAKAQAEMAQQMAQQNMAAEPKPSATQMATVVAAIMSEEEIYEMLDLMFPAGIPARKIKMVNEWVELTKGLLNG